MPSIGSRLPAAFQNNTPWLLRIEVWWNQNCWFWNFPPILIKLSSSIDLFKIKKAAMMIESIIYKLVAVLFVCEIWGKCYKCPSENVLWWNVLGFWSLEKMSLGLIVLYKNVLWENVPCGKTSLLFIIWYFVTNMRLMPIWR